MSPNDLEREIRASPGPPAEELSRRWDEEEQVLSIDCRRHGIAHTAGLYRGELTFVSLHWDAAEAGQERGPGHGGGYNRVPGRARAVPGLVRLVSHPCPLQAPGWRACTPRSCSSGSA